VEWRKRRRTKERRVSRTLRLLEEPGGAAGAQLYRLPSSYRRDFVCNMHDAEISISLCNSS
jgi:hypothetical protein